MRFVNKRLLSLVGEIMQMIADGTTMLIVIDPSNGVGVRPFTE